MDGARGARLPLAAAFRLRGLEARWELYHVMGRWVKYPQKSSEGASRWGEQALLDCPITKNRPEAALERAGRFIHHVQRQYHALFWNGYTK